MWHGFEIQDLIILAIMVLAMLWWAYEEWKG